MAGAGEGDGLGGEAVGLERGGDGGGVDRGGLPEAGNEDDVRRWHGKVVLGV